MLINYNITGRYGNWAVVTGATSGIGKAFCYSLASLDMNIIMIARRENILDEIKKDIEEKYKVEAKIVCADLSDKNEILKVVKTVEDYQVGLLVSNAGIGKIGDFSSNTSELITRMIGVNCLSSALLINEISRQMINNKRGAVINISSVMAKLPLSYAALYSGTKAFNMAFGEALYSELKKYNVDILTVLPGSTKTNFDGFGNKIGNSKQRTTEQVVETSLKALGKKAVVTDGLVNKLNIQLARLLPVKLRLAITGKYSERLMEQIGSNNHA